MSERSLETQFIAFRATRDPKALAAVFDATAAELLLVAVHLVGDRTEAEDVLQSTFVELIERAEKWDSARPLLPWIVGVLANRARMALRRRRRAPAQGEAKLEVEPPAAEAGPADAAHASEVAQHVSRALAGLPPRYRQVLVLHLVHGLGGVQIAQALMLPPATVRTQIKRGLELLRGALPRALAVPPALLLCEGRGLAAVKVAVLEHAGAVGTTAAAAAGVATLSGVTLGKLGGILLMKKLLLGVLALVLGVSVWIGLERGSGDSARPASEPSARSTPQPEGLPASDVGIAPASSATREAMALTPATNGSTIVRGRVVAAWNGRPLVASRVEIHATIDGADGIPSTYATLASGGSLADGSFERSFVARPRARHSISIAGGEFVPASGDIAVSGPGLLDLGDLRVERGSLLRVRIVDEQDRPVPNVSFVLETEAATLEGKTRMWGGAESDDEGILKPHDDQRVLPGEVSLEPRGPWEIVDPSRFLVATGIETSAPKVVVRPIREQDTLAGKVTDARGNGIAGVRVLVHFAQDRGFTGKDGGFRIYRKPADGASTRTTLSFVGSDKAVGVADVPVVWGAQDLSVVLPDAFTVPLLVVADDTGVPITEYRACFGGSNDPMFGRHDLAKHWRGGTHPGGRTELKGVPGSGKLCLIVAPSKGDHERSQQLEFDLPRTEPIVVRLLQRRPCSVLVADSEGKPVSGSRVQLIQLAGTEPAAEDPRPLPRADSWRNLQLRPQQPRPTWLIDEGTTDAAGMVRLACARPNANLAVRVSGRSHRVFRARLPSLGDEPFRAVVSKGAELVGRLTPGSFLAQCSRVPDAPRLDGVSLALREPAERMTHAVEQHPIAADGSFAIGGLDPGRKLLVFVWQRPITASSYQVEFTELPLAPLDLAAGERRELGNVDLSTVLPAMIRGNARLGGVPIADARVTLIRRALDAAGREESNLGDVRTDAAGNFAVGGLLEGNYLVHVERLGEDGSKLEADSESFVVRRGARLERAFEMSAKR